MGNTDFDMPPILYTYTGEYQIFVVPVTGYYKIECWGAQGCCGTSYNIYCYGGYTSGVIRLSKGTILYIYCGDGGLHSTPSSRWNGGGAAAILNDGNESWHFAGAGGGATDIRLVPGNWDNSGSLKSRIMVAGAGGGGNYEKRISPSLPSACGGGLNGYSGGSLIAYSSPLTRAQGGSQTSGGTGDDCSSVNSYVNGQQGSFGIGADASRKSGAGRGGGGAGYYGGGSGGTQENYTGSGAGGSSFISGHEGCNAINEYGNHTGQPNHFSGLVFDNTLMIDGAGYKWTTQKESLMLMPMPTEGTYASGRGHVGAGYCKISKVTN